MFMPLHLSVAFFTWGLLSAFHFALAGSQLCGMPDIPQCVIVALSWPSGTLLYDVTMEDQTHRNMCVQLTFDITQHHSILLIMQLWLLCEPQFLMLDSDAIFGHQSEVHWHQFQWCNQFCWPSKCLIIAKESCDVYCCTVQCC